MPHSLILNLTPKNSIPHGYLTGKHLHALFLNFVSSVDKDLGDRFLVDDFHNFGCQSLHSVICFGLSNANSLARSPNLPAYE